MKLYYAPGACSMAAHIALREAGLPHEIEKVDLGAKKTETGADYKAVNPKGYVPALALDDGQVLTEVAAVLQYVADQAPGKGLAPPAGTMERYRLQEWLGFVSSELHKGFSPLFKPNTPEDYKPIARENVANRLGMVEQRLGEGGYLMGEAFTVADAYCFVMLTWARRMGMDLARWPNLAAYADRVGARPAVRDVMREEGLTA